MTQQGDAAQALVPYISVRNAPAALAFYCDLFGAKPDGTPLRLPNGTIAHAQLRFGDCQLYLSEETEAWGNRAPPSVGGTPVRLALNVADIDELFRRAEAAGCDVMVPPSDQFYGERAGRLRDPFGHVWIVGQTLERLSPEEMQGRMDAMGS